MAPMPYILRVMTLSGREMQGYLVLKIGCSQAFRITKGRSRASRTGFTRRVVEGDISAIFMNLGLINICHSDFKLRGSAFDLICAASSRLKYNNSSLLVNRGMLDRSRQLPFH